MKCLGTRLALVGMVWVGVARGSALAADPAAGPADDSFAFFGAAPPQGPITASYLRVRHPLYLLDLTRQVKAGLRDRARVEALVGGRVTLDALLGMDLDALAGRLAEPDPGAPPSPLSLWHRVLTNDGTASPPPPVVPEALDFGEVGRGDSPRRVFRVTVASDGSLEALLPAGSPFQVVSMKSYGGVIVEAPAVPRDHVHPGGHRSPVAARLPAVGAPLGLEAPQPSRAPEVAREQPPWVLPVQAGQDVDIEVGLPVGPVAEPGGFISSTITVGSPLQGLWRQDVPLLANLALKGDIKIAVDVPEPLIDRVTEYSYNPSVPFTFVVPCFVSKPSPPQEVKGTIQPVALPPGVSMPAVNFTLQPQQKANASFTLSVDRSSSTWFDDETPYFFTIKVAYQTRPRRLRSRRGRRQ